MSTGISPLVMLAASMQAQPGVYAVMLGSGVSTGAGIPTGWGVVSELVRRVASATFPDDPEAGRSAAEDPEAWWAEHGDGELGYGSLLEQLAPTAAARQGLLAGFFEPTDEDREEGIRLPSKAHQAIAELVKRGYVRVIITTNFDRLMEQALEAVGVSPQVIARPEAVNGMAPLAHASATVIKLHGDYKDIGTRNTPTELSTYPQEWSRLLAQVFDEYGLVISGWSADWDEALVAMLEGAQSRRYPLYWDGRSSKGITAQRLLKARGGTTVPAGSADDLFGELAADIEALERLATPPLTTAMAVARLKRYLPDPVRRIDLDDLLMGSVDDVVRCIETQPQVVPHGGMQFAELDVHYEGYFRSMDQLAELLISGVWHDRDSDHDQLWCDVLHRLVEAGSRSETVSNDALTMARRIPALVALAVMGITATRRDRDQLLIRLATEVEGSVRNNGDKLFPAVQALHYLNVWNDDWVNGLPRWEETRWLYPASHLLKSELRRYFLTMFPVDDDFTTAFHGFEYRVGLLQTNTEGYRAIAGEYVGDNKWDWQEETPTEETVFRRKLERSRSSAWASYFGGSDELEQRLVSQRDTLKHYRRWR